MKEDRDIPRRTKIKLQPISSPYYPPPPQLQELYYVFIIIKETKGIYNSRFKETFFLWLKLESGCRKRAHRIYRRAATPRRPERRPKLIMLEVAAELEDEAAAEPVAVPEAVEFPEAPVVAAAVPLGEEEPVAVPVAEELMPELAAAITELTPDWPAAATELAPAAALEMTELTAETTDEAGATELVAETEAARRATTVMNFILNVWFGKTKKIVLKGFLKTGMKKKKFD